MVSRLQIIKEYFIEKLLFVTYSFKAILNINKIILNNKKKPTEALINNLKAILNLILSMIFKNITHTNKVKRYYHYTFQFLSS